MENNSCFYCLKKDVCKEQDNRLSSCSLFMGVLSKSNKVIITPDKDKRIKDLEKALGDAINLLYSPYSQIPPKDIKPLEKILDSPH